MTTYTPPRFEPCAMPYCEDCPQRQGIESENFPEGECPYSDPRAFPTTCSRHIEYVRDDRLIWSVARAVGIRDDLNILFAFADVLADCCRGFDEKTFREWVHAFTGHDPADDEMERVENELLKRRLARYEKLLGFGDGAA